MAKRGVIQIHAEVTGFSVRAENDSGRFFLGFHLRLTFSGFQGSQDSYIEPLTGWFDSRREAEEALGALMEGD